MTEFLAFDGEAIDGKYVLLGSSEGVYTYRTGGLTTTDILEFLTIPSKKVRVFYGMGYDTNMLMYGIPKETRIKFFHGERVFYSGYSLQLMGKKILKIWYRGHLFTYYDVRGFWQGSFMTAMESMHLPIPAIIEWGKSQRGLFNDTHIPHMIEYNKQECVLLTMMLDSLNLSLQELEIKLRSWHGSGAIASYVLRKNKWILPHVNAIDMPEPFECAYYGGRIELLQVGYQPHVYMYDINSAYPAAICKLPALDGRWTYAEGGIPRRHTGVSLVEWDVSVWSIRNPTLAGIFPWRAKDGYIQFGARGRGWYWQHEIEAARNLVKLHGGTLKLIRSYHTPYSLTPFRDLIPPIYALRQKYKSENDGRQLPLKLELNSMYGKFAQRVGKNPFQCIAWAGFITSYCRARLLDLIFGLDPKDIIGFATDSIALRKPLLDQHLSTNLGGLSKETYTQGNFFLLPGLAVYDTASSKPKNRVRGYSFADTFTWEDMFTQIHATGSASVQVKIFITNLLADRSEAYAPYRCQFVVGERGLKTVNPYDNFKRNYDFHHIDNPWMQGRLDQRTWGSKIPMFYRKQTSDLITESNYKQSWDGDIDLIEAEAIGGDQTDD